jgi:TM2 domain-containing membrane protein YozV
MKWNILCSKFFLRAYVSYNRQILKRRNSMTDNQTPVFYKNPSIATLLSFLFMGAGQIYNGEIKKGILFIVLYAVSIFLMSFLIGFITTPILWIWGMIDANKSAKRINQTMATKQA